MNENSESTCKCPSDVVYTFGVASGLANADLQAMQKFANDPTGLQIMAGQQTMSGLIADLTGQTPVLPVIFGYKHLML